MNINNQNLQNSIPIECLSFKAGTSALSNIYFYDEESDVFKDFFNQNTTIIENEESFLELETVFKKYSIVNWDGNEAEPIGENSRYSANFFLNVM